MTNTPGRKKNAYCSTTYKSIYTKGEINERQELKHIIIYLTHRPATASHQPYQEETGNNNGMTWFMYELYTVYELVFPRKIWSEMFPTWLISVGRCTVSGTE